MASWYVGRGQIAPRHGAMIRVFLLSQTGLYLALVPRLPTVQVAKEGDTVTITLDAAASQPVAEWAVSAFDLSGAQERERYVDVTLDRTTVTAGQTATLTITLRKRHPRRLSVVAIVSTMGDDSYIWPLAVVVR